MTFHDQFLVSTAVGFLIYTVKPLLQDTSLTKIHFVLGLNFIFFCLKLIIIHYQTQKQRKIKFKRTWIKLNHNICIQFLQTGENFIKDQSFPLDDLFVINSHLSFPNVLRLFGEG